MFEAFHHHFSPGHGSLGPPPPHPQPRCFTMHPLSSCRPAPCGSSGRSGRGTLRGSGSPVRAAVSTSISSPCWKIGTSLVGKTKPVVYHEPHGAGSWLSKLDRYDRFPRRERKKKCGPKNSCAWCFDTGVKRKTTSLGSPSTVASRNSQSAGTMLPPRRKILSQQ